MLFSDTDSSCCMQFSYLVICSLVDQNFHTNHREKMIIIMWVFLLVSNWSFDLDDDILVSWYNLAVSKNHTDRCAIPPDLRSGDYNFSITQCINLPQALPLQRRPLCVPASTLDEMMVQVRELRMQRSNVMAGFRFQNPTPASLFYSANATAIQLPSTASISEDVQFETPRRRVRAGDEYQRPPS